MLNRTRKFIATDIECQMEKSILKNKLNPSRKFIMYKSNKENEEVEERY